MNSVLFASSNRNKFEEVNSVLFSAGIIVEYHNILILEIQSNSLKQIAEEKSKAAYSKLSRPVLVEDDGLFIDYLNGFPGQYSAYVYKTIGNSGIQKLLEGIPIRCASFISVFAFYDGKNSYSFLGKTHGRISTVIRKGGWGFDGVFIPDSSDSTFGELQQLEKKEIFSHRTKALNKFKRWYLNN
jgi:XTP/dITP diphosphohydrolase